MDTGSRQAERAGCAGDPEARLRYLQARRRVWAGPEVRCWAFCGGTGFFGVSGPDPDHLEPEPCQPCNGTGKARLPWEDTDGRPGVWSLLAYVGDPGARQVVERVAVPIGFQATPLLAVVDCYALGPWLDGLSRWPPEVLTRAVVSVGEFDGNAHLVRWANDLSRGAQEAVIQGAVDAFGEAPTRTAISRALVAWALGE